MAILTPPQGSISQVCHVTHDLKAAAARWARIGAGPFFLLALPEIERNYRGGTAKDTFDAAIGFSGTTCIELVQPTNDQPSIFREVLDRHGEGAVHHHYPKIRCLTAPEYDALCASYRTLGYEEALSFHLPGLGRNSFFDATADLGFFLEVLEVPDAAYEYMMGGMYRQHVQWDGREPLRSIDRLT